MKNYKVKRVLAYFIDFLIVSVIVTLLSNVKVLNPKYKEYHETYEKYVEIMDEKITANKVDYAIDDEMENIMYKLSRYGISYTVIELVTIMLYYTLFPLFFEGQTIGKKITKLQITSRKDDSKPPFIKLLLRALIYPIFSTGLFYCSFTMIGNVLGLIIFKQAYFLTINKAFLIIGLAWGYIDAIYLISRKDNIALHDILCGTE